MTVVSAAAVTGAGTEAGDLLSRQGLQASWGWGVLNIVYFPGRMHGEVGTEQGIGDRRGSQQPGGPNGAAAVGGGMEGILTSLIIGLCLFCSVLPSSCILALSGWWSGW